VEETLVNLTGCLGQDGRFQKEILMEDRKPKTKGNMVPAIEKARVKISDYLEEALKNGRIDRQL
jgi:hypothetical protein